MSFCIAQVSLDRDTLLAEDIVTNTFHFEDDSVEDGIGGGGGFSVNGPGLISRLQTFYQALGIYLSSTLTGTGNIRLYNHQSPKPRIPVREAPLTFTPATNSLPGEVAACLSYRADREQGAIAARRRGRVFLGPLALRMTQTQVAGQADVRPSDTDLQAILQAARTMARGGSGSFRLAVYSPTTYAATQSYADAYTDVGEIWMDNALDTIRSRGARRTRRFIADLDNADVPILFA